jgi:hypothetical protein
LLVRFVGGETERAGSIACKDEFFLVAVFVATGGGGGKDEVGAFWEVQEETAVVEAFAAPLLLVENIDGGIGDTTLKVAVFVVTDGDGEAVGMLEVHEETVAVEAFAAPLIDNIDGGTGNRKFKLELPRPPSIAREDELLFVAVFVATVGEWGKDEAGGFSQVSEETAAVEVFGVPLKDSNDGDTGNPTFEVESWPPPVAGRGTVSVSESALFETHVVEECDTPVDFFGTGPVFDGGSIFLPDIDDGPIKVVTLLSSIRCCEVEFTAAGLELSDADAGTDNDGSVSMIGFNSFLLVSMRIEARFSAALTPALTLPLETAPTNKPTSLTIPVALLDSLSIFSLSIGEGCRAAIGGGFRGMVGCLWITCESLAAGIAVDMLSARRVSCESIFPDLGILEVAVAVLDFLDAKNGLSRPSEEARLRWEGTTSVLGESVANGLPRTSLIFLDVAGPSVALVPQLERLDVSDALFARVLKVFAAPLLLDAVPSKLLLGHGFREDSGGTSEGAALLLADWVKGAEDGVQSLDGLGVVVKPALVFDDSGDRGRWFSRTPSEGGVGSFIFVLPLRTFEEAAVPDDDRAAVGLLVNRSAVGVACPCRNASECEGLGVTSAPVALEGNVEPSGFGQCPLPTGDSAVLFRTWDGGEDFDGGIYSSELEFLLIALAKYKAFEVAPVPAGTADNGCPASAFGQLPWRAAADDALLRVWVDGCFDFAKRAKSCTLASVLIGVGDFPMFIDALGVDESVAAALLLGIFSSVVAACSFRKACKYEAPVGLEGGGCPLGFEELDCSLSGIAVGLKGWDGACDEFGKGGRSSAVASLLIAVETLSSFTDFVGVADVLLLDSGVACSLRKESKCGASDVTPVRLEGNESSLEFDDSTSPAADNDVLLSA